MRNANDYAHAKRLTRKKMLCQQGSVKLSPLWDGAWGISVRLVF